jgi:Myb DNA-binding like
MTLSSAKETESGEDVTIANASRITTSTAQVMPQEQRLPAHMHNTTTAVPPSRNINKPSRKKRKATTVLAVGASRDKSRSVANSNSNEETSTTLQIVGVSNNGNSKSTHESGTHRNFDGTVSEMMHDEQSVANSESNETLKTQQQLVEQHSEPMESPLRSTNSHMPLELIPPIIPENTTGKPTLSTFCSTYPKPKQPRRTKQRSLATLIGASAGSTINDKNTTTTTDITNNANANTNSSTTTTTASTTQNPSANHNWYDRTVPIQQPQPQQHAGPVLQIVDGEIVLQESSMIFHGAVNDSVNHGTGIGVDTEYGNYTNHHHEFHNSDTNQQHDLHNNHEMMIVEEEAEMAIVGATYSSFATGRRARPNVSHWTVEETQLFYEALQQVGLDFGTMEAYFEAAAASSSNTQSNNNNNTVRFRQRRQLKRKYQAEYNKNPQLIEKALQRQGRVGIDLSVFQLSNEQIHAEQEQVDSTVATTPIGDESKNSTENFEDHHHPSTSSTQGPANLPENDTEKNEDDERLHYDALTNNEESIIYEISAIVDETALLNHAQQTDENIRQQVEIIVPTHYGRDSRSNPPMIMKSVKATRPLRSVSTRKKTK